MAGQTASPQAPQGTVSDWTHHHLLYPESGEAAQNAQIQNNPRWQQNWYFRHPEAWWPQYRLHHHRPRAKRDWSVPLGSGYFGPPFDFTFSIGTEAGYGSFTTADQGGGEFLATGGSLTVTGAADAGTYPLIPGGPGIVTSPNGSFVYDNLVFPTANPVFDSSGGPLWDGGGGLEFNIWSNGPDNYSFYTGYSGGNYPIEISGPGVVTVITDPGGGQTFPAKYVFDVNSAPSCANDFVVIGIPASASGTQANILGLNNLYSNSAGTGYCPTTGPTVLFAYTSGTGQVPASLVISQNGQQLAYVENLSGSSYFHDLTWGTTGTNGTGATSAVVPGVTGGNNAVDNRVLLSPDGIINQSSTNAPFVYYTPNDANDVAYVSTYSIAGFGYLYKIGNVFNGSVPTILWSAPITAIPSAPIYDQVSNKVFFTDCNGRIDYVVDSGVFPSVVYGAVVAAGATSENAVIVDTTHQMIYAFFNSNGTNAIVVQAPTSMASSVSVPVGAATTTYTGPYLPDFNHAWYTGIGTPIMYVAGTGTGTLPTLYGVGFTGGVMNSSASASAALTTGPADSSPVSEFYNATLAKDFLFVGVSDNCVATALGGSAGCIMSLDITAGFPTINAGATALAVAGGTSGIIPDNNSNLAEASSVYYTTKTGATLVKATQSALQ